MQIMPMQGEIRKAVERHRNGAGVEGLPGLAGVPEADDFLGRDHGDLHDLALQAEVEEHAGPVRAELQARAHLVQVGRLLVDGDLVAAADQRQGGGQPAQARADDGDAAEAHAP